MAGKQRRYRIWCVYDTETSNAAYPDGNVYAWPILYIFNDVHAVDMRDYEVDCPGEHVTFLRHEEDAQAYIDRMIEDAVRADCIPVMCVYNAIFDLQTIMSGLHDRYDMEVNAQSSTNIYTLDLLKDGRKVLRIWDTYHLEMRGLRAMGSTCGVAKLMGDWDYDLIRSPETPLTDEELGYAARDVQVIPAYLRYLCEAHEWLTPDMLGQRVLTKTSLVRQMARHEIGNLRIPKKGKLNLLKAFESLCRREQPYDYASYATRLACFRGGLTFTAALTASTVVERVYSLDETSAHHAFINGRRVPIGFHVLTPDVLDFWLEDIQRYTTYDVLHNYAYPFQRWFHACVRFDNLRPKKGSAFEAWGIGLLAQAKFLKRVPLSDISTNNERAIDGMEEVRANGYVDSAYGATYAFGKLMEAEQCSVWVSELEFWCMTQVYEWDACHALAGEGTIKSIWPPDFVTLQSNMLYLRKNDAKVINNNYHEGEPYQLDVPASVPDGIREGLQAGSFSNQFVSSWYGNAVKGSFNSIYGTQAQNVLKPEYIVAPDDELRVDRSTRTTDANFDERIAEVKHPMVLYTYGLRIVGGSRMQLVIAMQLLYEAFGGAIIVTGGDTDSLKVACMEGIDSDMLLEALEPLHVATTKALRLCMARLRENYPTRTADLTGVGCFEVEPATKTCDYYPLHMEAWNKARVSIDDAGNPHVTMAGLSRPADAYHIVTWTKDMLEQGHDPRELLPRAFGYNVTIQNEVCHALERTSPKFRDPFMADVTDYLGNKTWVDTHQAIALFDSNRRIGDLMKNQNRDNVEYLENKYGRHVSQGEKILTVEYDYTYACALMGKTWHRFVYRHFVDNFTKPKLYQQTLEGMEAI